MAGRSIGEVQATLSADTRRFVSEVKRVTDQAENEEVDINLGAEVDEADLKAAIEQVQNAVARADSDLDIGAEVDTADVDDALERIRRKIENADSDVGIGGEMDTSDLDAAISDVEDKIAAAAADVGIGGEVDTEDLDDALRRIGIKVEDLDLAVGIGGEMDTADLDAALDAIQAKVDRAAVSADIGGNPALADLDAALADIGVYVSAANIEASIGGSPDLIDLDLALADIGVVVDASHFEVPIGGDVDWAQVDIALGLVEDEVDNRNPDVDIGGNKNHVDVEAALDLVQLEVDARHPEVDIGADVDTTDKTFTEAESAMTTWAGNTGQAGGKSFTKGFSSSMSDGSEILIAAVVALGTDAATALEGALGGATAIISHAIEAAAGSAGALIGIGAGIAGTLAAVFVGASGVSGALKAVTDEVKAAKEEGRTIHLFSGPVGDALATLTPNAQAFAIAWGDTHDNIQDVKGDVQEALFAGLSTELQTLSQETIPDVGGALVIAAGWANLLFTNLSHVAQDVDFTGIAEGLSPAMTNIVDAVTALASSFGPLLEEVSPAAEELAGWLEDGAEALADYVIKNPETMTQFFDDGVTKLEQWGRLLGAAATLLGTIIGAASPTGGTALDAITGTLDRWETFLSGDLGQAKMQEFFGGVEETWTGMDPLFQGLKEAWSILTEEGTAASFHATMTALGDAMPAIAEALGIMGDIGLVSAFSNIIQTFEPLLDLIGDLPDELLAGIGQMIAWYKTVKLMDAAVDGLLKTISTAQKNPWMLAVAAALTVATAAMSFFGSKEDDAREATDQFGDSLQTAITHIVGSQEASDGATAAMEAMDAAFLDTTKNNDKVTDAMLKLGVGTDGAAQSLLALHSEGDTANTELERLAENVLGNQEAAEGLAAIVGTTDDNFAGLADRLGDVQNWLQTNNQAYDENADSIQELADSSGNSIDTILTNVFGMSNKSATAFADLAASTGIPIDSLLDLAGAMEEMSDQGEKIDFQSIAKEQLTLAATGDDASQALLQAALDAKGMNGSFDEVLSTTEDLVPLFQEYINQLYGTADAQDAANAAATGGLSAQEFINSQIEDGIALQKEKAEATRESQREAFRAYRDEQRAATDLLDAVREVATSDLGLPSSVVDTYMDLGKAFDDATEASNAFSDAMTILIGGFGGWEEAVSGAEEALDTLREGMKDTNAEGEEFTVPPAFDAITGFFDTGEEAGREYAAMARDAASAILEVGAAGFTSGEDLDSVIGKMSTMREDLQQQLIDLGMGETAAENYVNALLGAPDVMETTISMPGVVDALLNAEDLTVLYDAMGNPVVTEFEALGLDLTDEQMRALHDLIEEIDGQKAEPTVTVDDQATDVVEGVQGDVDTLDDSSADPALKLTDQINMINALGTVGRQITALNDMVADPTLELTDYILIITELHTLQTEVKNYDTLYADPNLQLTQYSTVLSRLDTLISRVRTFDSLTPSVSISLPGIWDRIHEVERLQTEIAQLHDKTVTVHVNRTGSTPQLMAGGIVTGEGTFTLGERGLREAVIPLDLPLSRVDPSVRELATLLRGQVALKEKDAGPRVQVNQVIQPISADPVDVSIQVVNRIAALIE